MLKKITVHNFKNLKDISIDFPKKISELNDFSAQEKSSILDATAILLSSLFRRIDGARSIQIKKDDAFMLSGCPQYPISLNATADILNESIEWTIENDTKQSSTSYKKATSAIGVSESIRKRLMHGDTSLILPVFAYYSLCDGWKEKTVISNEVRTRTQGYKNCLTKGKKDKAFYDFLLKLTIQKLQNSEIGITNPVSELEVCLDTIKKGYRMLSGDTTCSIQYKLLENELMIVDGGTRTPVSKLVREQEQSIYLITDIACRMAALNPQLMEGICKSTDGIVLIDDIKNGLTEEYQDKLINILAVIFPRVQFIISKG